MVDQRDDGPTEPDPAAGPGKAERGDRDRDRANIERDRDDTLRQRVEALVPEIVKRTFAAGLGAVFSTEEGIRKLAKDISIPNVAGDVAGYLASTADTTKDKVVEIVAREVREFLQTMNFGEEIAKMLTTLSFEIKTEIRFIPNSEKYTGVEPDVKASAKLKRAPSAPPGAPNGDAAAAAEPEKKSRRFWRRDEGDEPDDDTEK